MKNVNESGRSMVEMLGVLAIIGVLSIGGIAGYTRAMRGWNANEILDAANRVVVLAETEDDGTASYTAADGMGDVTKIGAGLVTGISASRSGKTVTINLKGAITASPYEELKAAIEDKLGTGNKLGDYTVTVSGPAS